MAEQLWSDERIAKVTHGLYVSADRVTVISIETMRSFMQMVSDDLQAALDAANATINELQDALDGMRGIAQQRMDRVKELEKEVDKYKRACVAWEEIDKAQRTKIAKLEAQLVAGEAGVSKQQAQNKLISTFGLKHAPKLRYTEFSQTYPDSGGPLGGIGGQAITAFTLQAWYDAQEGYAVIFYGDKILRVMDMGEFNVYSTYESYALKDRESQRRRKETGE